jgi:hypothetical protein
MPVCSSLPVFCLCIFVFSDLVLSDGERCLRHPKHPLLNRSVVLQRYLLYISCFLLPFRLLLSLINGLPPQSDNSNEYGDKTHTSISELYETINPLLRTSLFLFWLLCVVELIFLCMTACVSVFFSSSMHQCGFPLSGMSGQQVRHLAHTQTALPHAPRSTHLPLVLFPFLFFPRMTSTLSDLFDSM